MVERIINNSKDIMMTLIVFFVTIFFLIFYTNLLTIQNAFVGITTIAILLMLFDRDLTDRPYNNSLKLLFLNALMLLAAVIFSWNFSLFLLINFLLCFLIGYYFSYDLNKPIYLPFLLQYIYLLANPVTGLEDYSLRLVALLIGPFIFLLLQLVVNYRYPFKKAAISTIGLIGAIRQKILLILNNDPVRAQNNIINNINNEFRGVLYEQRINGLLSTEECVNYLALSIALEKLSSNVSSSNLSKAMHQDLIILIDIITEYLNNNVKINKVSRFINDYIDNYQTKTMHRERLELFNTLNLIKERLSIINRQKSKTEYTNNLIPALIKRLKLDKYFDYRSLSFAFAMKLATGITLIYLLADILGLMAVIWIVLAFVLTVKYTYQSDYKGQIIDVILIFTVAFGGCVILSIINLPTIMSLILSLIFVYILNVSKKDMYRIIAGAIVVIGLILTSPIEVKYYLIIAYLIAGSVIGLAFNNYFLPFKLRNQSTELKHLFYEVIKDMMQEIYASINDPAKKNAGSTYVNSLYLTSSLILEQLNSYLKRMTINDHLMQSKRRHLSADLYELYIVSDRIADLKNIKKQFNYIFKTTNYRDLYPVKMDSSTKYTIDDKLAVILLNNIIRELQATNLRK